MGNHRDDAAAGPNRFGTGGFFIAPVLLALAGWFSFGPNLAAVPSAPSPKVNAALLTVGPARTYVASDPPVLHINGFDRTCNECHRTFRNPNPRVTALEQHKDVKLAHGANNHCYVCHDLDDRNYLRAVDGSKLSFAQPVELCAQCHEAIGRDWRRGLHGKRLGHWDTTRGQQDTILCVGCHDPHWPSRPAMSGLKPMPGPHTLRMGPPDAEHEVDDDPLQRAVRRAERETR